MLLGLGCKEAMQYSEMYDGSNAMQSDCSNPIKTKTRTTKTNQAILVQ